MISTSDFCAILVLTLSLSFLGNSSAASLDLTCRVSSEGTISTVKLNGTGLSGKYYAKIFSGENVVQTDAKMANKRGSLEFKFHTDPDYVANNPGTDKILTDFITRREVVGILRKAGTHARIGGIRAKCRILKIKPSNLQSMG
jgi:hypothetical protein